MSKKKIIVGLSDFENIAKALHTYADDLKKSNMEIAKEVANQGLTKLNEEYKNLYNDPNLTDIQTKVEKKEKGYSITAYGDDVVYAEFGTGDMGAQNSHPKKSDYNLNPYNSGETIRDVSSLQLMGKALQNVAEHGIVSGKYWTYKKDGAVHYTQGVPAGKQMYNIVNYLKSDDGVKKIVQEKLGEINDKFINSIKK